MIAASFRSSRTLSSIILVSVLGLPFALIGCAMAYKTLSTLVSAESMNKWPTASGLISAVELASGGGETDKITVAYSYTIDGQTFNGNRVSLYGPDNIGNFYKKTFDELNEYYSQQEALPVYYNPLDPRESILKPLIRWEIVAFYLVFVILFGGAGWSILISSFLSLKRQKLELELEKRFPNEPWRHRLEWATSRIKSEQSSQAFWLVAVSIFWNACSFPMLFAIPEKIRNGEYLILIVLIFPALGLGLIYWSAIQILRARRFGNTFLELTTYPGRINETLKGRIVAPSDVCAVQEIKLQLICERYYRVTSSSSSGTSITSVTVWKKDSIVRGNQGRTATGESAINIEFTIPAGLPESSNGSHEWFTWALKASAPMAGADFEADFQFPVMSR